MASRKKRWRGYRTRKAGGRDVAACSLWSAEHVGFPRGVRLWRSKLGSFARVLTANGVLRASVSCPSILGQTIASAGTAGPPRSARNGSIPGLDARFRPWTRFGSRGLAHGASHLGGRLSLPPVPGHPSPTVGVGWHRWGATRRILWVGPALRGQTLRLYARGYGMDDL